MEGMDHSCPPGCTRFSPGIRFPTFPVFSLQISLGRQGRGRRSTPGPFFGYLGFRGSTHGAPAHRQCRHRAVTCTQGPSVIRRSGWVVQAVAHRESHDSPLKATVLLCMQVFGRGEACRLGRGRQWRTAAICTGIPVAKLCPIAVVLLSTETPAWRASPTARRAWLSIPGLGRFPGRRRLCRDHRASRWNWINGKGAAAGSSAASWPLASHLTPDLLCYSRPAPTSHQCRRQRL